MLMLMHGEVSGVLCIGGFPDLPRSSPKTGRSLLLDTFFQERFKSFSLCR